MKNVYPVLMSQCDGWIVATIPDFDRSTQGKNMVEAIAMARDLIELTGITLQDLDQPIPEPSTVEFFKADAGDFVTLVDVDFDAYRAQMEIKSIRKNCTLPSWLNTKAEQANVNFSQVLQEALIEKLGLADKKGA